MSTLHRFQLLLTGYVRVNLVPLFREPPVIRFASLIDPELLNFFTRDDAAEREMLLNLDELEELEHLFRELPPRYLYPWHGHHQVHRQAIFCVREIRDSLSPTEAEDWSQASHRFAESLEREGLSVQDSLEIVGEWSLEIERLLVAMGQRQYLPAPIGEQPTPTCCGSPANPATEKDAITPGPSLKAARPDRNEKGRSTADQSSAAQSFTPAQAGRRHGVSASKVIYWIETNQLVAINIAKRADGRPRYRIRPADLLAFEVTRSARPTKGARPRRRRPAANVIQYY